MGHIDSDAFIVVSSDFLTEQAHERVSVHSHTSLDCVPEKASI